MAHFNDIHPKENDETREWLRQTSSQLGPCQPPKGSTSALSKPMFTSLGFGNLGSASQFWCSSLQKCLGFAPSLPIVYIHHIKSMTLCKIHLVTRLNETQLKGSRAVATLGVAKKVLQEGRGVVPVQILRVSMGLPVTSHHYHGAREYEKRWNPHFPPS